MVKLRGQQLQADMLILSSEGQKRKVHYRPRETSILKMEPLDRSCHHQKSRHKTGRTQGRNIPTSLFSCLLCILSQKPVIKGAQGGSARGPASQFTEQGSEGQRIDLEARCGWRITRACSVDPEQRRRQKWELRRH